MLTGICCTPGVEIIRRALRIPAWTIIANTGIEPSVILEKVIAEKERNMGYDSLEGEMCDLMKRGIIDPTKVGIISALLS